MPEYLTAFDRVVVVDRLALTGRVLAQLADHVMGHACSEHVFTLAALQECLCRYAGMRLLVVTELITDRERFSEALQVLGPSGALRRHGHCQVMVCTDLSEPLLLRQIAEHRPDVIALRSEPLSVLRTCLKATREELTDTFLSPEAARRLAQAEMTHLTGREQECLMHLADGLSLQSVARVMNVSYKTAVHFRNSIANRMGLRKGRSFFRRLGLMQQASGNSAGSDTKAG